MIRKSLVLLFLVPWYSTAEYSSFIASFQSQGYWSEHEYLEYKDELPELKSFTVCHWEKTQFLSDSFNTIWAYCHHLSANDLSLRCMEAFHTTPGEKGHSVMFFNKLNWGPEKSRIRKAWVISYRHRNWNHFCIVHSNTHKDTQLYHNGKHIKAMAFEGDDGPREYYMPKSTTVYDSAFTIGQEPDSLRGGFDKGEAFPGNISEFNVWDRALDEVEISAIVKCIYTKRGNIITWDLNKFSLNEVTTTDLSDPHRRIL